VLKLLPYWQLTYDQQLWDTRNNSLGLLAKYRRDFAPMRARVIVGADADYSPGSFVANQLVAPRTGPDSVWSSYTKGAASYDYDVTYRAVSPYVHTEFSPLARLRIDAGLRYDVAGYDYRTNLAPTDSTERFHKRPPSTTVSYAHLSPKLGMTVDVAPGLSAFASYRHGFRAPSQGQLFQQNSAANTVGLEPVKVDSYEAGVRGQVGRRLLYQLSAYDMTIRDDIITFVTAENLRVATNAGKTRHRGIEAAVGAALAPALRLDASYAVSSQRYVAWEPTATSSFSGNLIEQAPRELGSVLLAYSPRVLGGGRLAVEWSKTGRYEMDAQNTRSYGGFELWSLHASYVAGQRAELFARVSNLLNRNYAELASYNAFERNPADRAQYSPGAPRAVYAGIRYTLQ